jgi:hypothetical protein
MNIITIMNYEFNSKQKNELFLCLHWIKQAKKWLKPTDNVFIYSSKVLPKVLIDEMPTNFKQCVTYGSKNLETSVPKDLSEMIWYKLYILCHFPYKALFLDADAIIMDDISELNNIELTINKPLLMIDHENNIIGHTAGKPPTVNSGSLLLNNLASTRFSWKNLIDFGRKIGFVYRYKNSNELIPGNDQALLQAYCDSIDYDYHNPVFDIKYNSCAGVTKKAKILHYWGPFKPWKMNMEI